MNAIAYPNDSVVGTDSAAITPSSCGATSRSSSTTLAATAHFCATLGLFLFGGGLGFSSQSAVTVRPIVVQGASSARVSLVDISEIEGATGIDKKSELLGLVGSWEGDDFETCLEIVYATRSGVETGDVPS